MQSVVAPLIYILAFIAVVLAVQAIGGVVLNAREKTRRVNRRLTLLDSGLSHEQVYASLVRESGVAGGTRIADLEKRVAGFIRQADLAISARRLILMTTGAAAGLWVFALLVLRAGQGNFLVNGMISLVAAIAISVFGAYAVISSRRTKRLKQIEDQLPLALDIIIRALRAGHPVISAVQLAAQEMGDPLGSEFGLIVDETTYGLEFKDALENFARRTGSRDAAFFAVSVAIQAQTGGNLAEILDGLAQVVRGRNTLAKRVKALASEGKASAWLLSVLPFLLIGFFLLVQPSFYTSKFGDPIFWPTTMIVLVVYLIGLAMIRKIINFKY